MEAEKTELRWERIPANPCFRHGSPTNHTVWLKRGETQQMRGKELLMNLSNSHCISCFPLCVAHRSICQNSTSWSASYTCTLKEHLQAMLCAVITQYSPLALSEHVFSFYIYYTQSLARRYKANRRDFGFVGMMMHCCVCWTLWNQSQSEPFT